MKTNHDIQSWLQPDEPPAIPEDRMNELIAVGKAYMESAEFNQISLQSVLLSQLQYLSPSFWVAQIALAAIALFLVCRFGPWKVTLRYALTAL